MRRMFELTGVHHCAEGQGALLSRDALHLGDCDDAVRQLCELLGWSADLGALIGAEAATSQ